jgi:arylsulfatase A-like enzyme
VAENKARPFFLYVPFHAGHFPYQGRSDPPHRTPGRTWTGEERLGPLPKEQRKRAYRDLVESADAGVGQILEALDSAGLRERTLVVLSSDNGGYVSVSNNGPYRGEKGNLLEGGHRVAAMARWPGRIKPGSTTNVTAMTVDFMPTFLAVSNTPRPAGLKLDGVDLSGVLFRGETLAERPLFWRDVDEKAVRLGPWKLIVQEQGTALYNLDRDPGETRDLAGQEPGRVRDLSARLAAWEADVGPRSVKQRPSEK